MRGIRAAGILRLLLRNPKGHPYLSICANAHSFADYGMSYVNNEAQFRFPIAFQIFFALLTIALIVFLPESPRWVSLFSSYVQQFPALN